MTLVVFYSRLVAQILKYMNLTVIYLMNKQQGEMLKSSLYGNGDRPRHSLWWFCAFLSRTARSLSSLTVRPLFPAAVCTCTAVRQNQLSHWHWLTTPRSRLLVASSSWWSCLVNVRTFLPSMNFPSVGSLPVAYTWGIKWRCEGPQDDSGWRGLVNGHVLLTQVARSPGGTFPRSYARHGLY